jgi:hypothetical protein
MVCVKENPKLKYNFGRCVTSQGQALRCVRGGRTCLAAGRGRLFDQNRSLFSRPSFSRNHCSVFTDTTATLQRLAGRGGGCCRNASTTRRCYHRVHPRSPLPLFLLFFLLSFFFTLIHSGYVLSHVRHVATHDSMSRRGRGRVRAYPQMFDFKPDESVPVFLIFLPFSFVLLFWLNTRDEGRVNIREGLKKSPVSSPFPLLLLLVQTAVAILAGQAAPSSLVHHSFNIDVSLPSPH